MGRKSIDLKCATPDGWTDAVLADFENFIADHANCERKACALAMSMVTKYSDRPNLLPFLIDLAKEELEHFADVYAVMEKRGIPLQRDEADPYVNRMLACARHGRDERLIDRMLICSLIESRGAERFKLLADALEDDELSAFYEELYRCELKHGHQFVHELLKEFDEEVVYPRLHELAEIEAQIVNELEFRAALH